jgi:hypothetical protein
MAIRKVLASMAVLALLAVGCDRTTESQEAEISPVPSPIQQEESPDPGGSPEPAAEGEGAAGRQASSPAPPPKRSAPLAAQAVRPPAPGAYLYDEEGTRSAGTCGEDGPPPTPTALDVQRGNGSRQRTVWDRTDGNDGMVVTTDLQYRPDGIFLLYLHQEQKTAVGPVTSEFQPSTPPLVMPAQPRASQRWSFTLKSKDGKLTVEVTNTIESVSERVRLGSGEAVDAVRIFRRSHARGQSLLGNVDLVEESRVWVAPAARLQVRSVSDTSGTVGTCQIESHIETTLRSTKPS